MDDVAISTDTIRLGQLLKLAGLVDSGSDAKFLLAGGEVSVNGETETRRGRQLRAGGQLFFPLDRRPFFVPLALPGDDVQPEQFVCFRFDGTQGLYIHPNVWHEGVFAQSGTQRFFDQQGAVHARVSVDFAREFGCLLEAPLA
mgnify:CR=1 FL=1